MHFESLPHDPSSDLAFGECGGPGHSRFFRVIPVWSVIGNTDRFVVDYRHLRIACCCVGTAMELGWREARRLNSVQCLTSDPARVVGVCVTVIEGAEAEALKKQVAQIKPSLPKP